MKREVLGSMFLGLFCLSLINLFIEFDQIDIIMTGISIYSVMMTIGQFLYRFKEIINEPAFKMADKKTRSFYDKGFVIGTYFVQFSFVAALFGTYIIYQFFGSNIASISNSLTILAMGVIFLYIGFYEE